jgi:acyl-CoA thioesterase FadM
VNLYFRLLWTLLRAWRLPKLVIGATLQREFRVMPNDLDINLHMNNGRYLTLIDLMLLEYFVRVGFMKALLKNSWRPMAGGSFITYRRGLEPFQIYTVRYRVDACDDNWNYMRFEFLNKDKVCAAGYMKGAVVGRKGLVSNAQSYAALGVSVPTSALPIAVNSWLSAEQNIMQTPW